MTERDQRTTVAELECKLQEAIQAYLAEKNKVERLQQEIAETLCPLQVGERVTVVNKSIEYDGVVDNICAITDIDFYLGPQIGMKTGWSASGKRINKTTGKIGTHSFGIGSFSSIFQNGKWVILHSSITKVLNTED